NPINLQGQNPMSALGFGGFFGLVTNSSKGVADVISTMFNGNPGNIIGAALSGILITVATIVAVSSGPVGWIAGLGALGGVFGIGSGSGAAGGINAFGMIGFVIAFLVIAIALLI